MAHTQTLGEFIEQKRLDLHLSKVQAAKRAGVSRQTWAEIERGSRMNVMPETMRLIEQALELEPGALRRQSRPLTDEELQLASDALATADGESAVLEANRERRQQLVAYAAQLSDRRLRDVLTFIERGTFVP